MQYQLYHLKDHSRPGALGLIEFCDALVSEHDVYGRFGGLFGLASNEIYLVTNGQPRTTIDLPDHIELLTTIALKPTSRPTEHSPRTKAGVYVFRWFNIEPQNVDEIVALSGTAWPSFEKYFDAEIQGLFVEAVKVPSRMLLLTRYGDLGAWELSRRPSAEATENFLKRHQLTLNATPIATTLLGGDGKVQISHR